MNPTRTLTGPLLALPLFAIPAAAQGFNNTWLEFRQEATRLVAAPSEGSADNNEKDFATGDLDQNGFDDLVVVRKQPAHTTGRRTNVLLMNSGGTLVDSTAALATASDVPGDMGFMTPTNDRDVVIVDVDMDGWLDVVTSTTLSPGQPKHISHPRVYRNLGNDMAGTWLGLRNEDARFPQLLLAGGAASWPRFTAVAAGDLTGDGFPDLYFGDNQNAAGQGGGDMNDRLLVNDGLGNFVDETAARMTTAISNTDYTTAVSIVDLNLDGLADIMRNRGHGGGISVAYNNPLGVGNFSLAANASGGSTYYTSVGDLNADSRPDLLTSHNGTDRSFRNIATNANGTVQWSPNTNVQFVTGTDDGFAGDNYIVDLDLDGRPDAVVTDFDIEVAGCGRRTHIYHNETVGIGASVVLREEAQQPAGGWRGAVGLLAGDLTGTHDAAFLDIDADGDPDMVLGRCVGLRVWVNTTIDGVGTPFCFCDGASAPCGNPGGPGAGCLNGQGTSAVLGAAGSGSLSMDDLVCTGTGLNPNQPALLFTGLNALSPAPTFGNGLRCAGGGLIRLGIKFSSASGVASWGPSLLGSTGIPAGTTRRFQIWYRDPFGGACGQPFNTSNGLELVDTP